MITNDEGKDQAPTPRRFLGDRPGGAGDPPHPPAPEDGLLRWRVDRMGVLGIPRDWEAVRLGLHPFTPERVVVLPSSGPLDRGVLWEREVCDRIDERIDRGRSEMRCGP